MKENRNSTERGKIVIILNVFFDVQQQHEDKFVKLLNNMVVQSNKEEGCSLYQLYKNDHERCSYMLVEHWESQAHLDAHAQSEHWIHFNDTVNDFLYSEYEEHHYEEIAQ